MNAGGYPDDVPSNHPNFTGGDGRVCPACEQSIDDDNSLRDFPASLAAVIRRMTEFPTLRGGLGNLTPSHIVDGCDFCIKEIMVDMAKLWLTRGESEDALWLLAELHGQDLVTKAAAR